MDAWRMVKSNTGSTGIDGKSHEKFEKDLKDNLYKIWNRPVLRDLLSAFRLDGFRIMDPIFRTG
jgi:hypothetical protein